MSLLKYIKKRISSDELHAVVSNVAVEPKKSAKQVAAAIEAENATNLEKREEIKRRLATPLNPDDFYKVEDALLLIAEDQPTVARSTPKNQIPNSTDASSRVWAEKEMAHCLFDRPFYNAMITSSLKTCEQLQENLDVYVTEVRKSSSTNFEAKN